MTYDADKSYERRMAACILQHEEMVRKYRAVLSADFFNDEDLSIVIGSFLKFYDKRQSIPDKHELNQAIREYYLTLPSDQRKDRIRAMKSLVTKLYRVKMKNYEDYEDKILAYGQIELVTSAVEAFAVDRDGLNDLDQDDVTRIISELMSQVEKARIMGSRLELPKKYTRTMQERITFRAQANAEKVPTGVEKLDAVFGGGISLGEVFSIWADTGVGKTALNMFFLGSAMISGYRSLLFIGEEQFASIGSRMDSRFSGMSFEEMALGPDKARRALRPKLRGLRGEVYICEFDISKPFSAASIVQILTQLEAETGHHIPVVSVDSPDHMNSANPADSEWLMLKRVMRELNQINKGTAGFFKKKRVLAVTSQVNRTGDDLIGTGNYTGTKEKANISDKIITLNQTRDEHASDELRINVAKNRGGVSNRVFSIRTNLALGKFLSMKKTL